MALPDYEHNQTALGADNCCKAGCLKGKFSSGKEVRFVCLRGGKQQILQSFGSGGVGCDLAVVRTDDNEVAPATVFKGGRVEVY